MKENYLLQHKTALLNPYGSIVQVLDGDPDKLLVGIKNVRSIPNTLMHNWNLRASRCIRSTRSRSWRAAPSILS